MRKANKAPNPRGYGIFLTRLRAQARRVLRLSWASGLPRSKVLSGDELVRQVPPNLRLARAHALFVDLLDAAEALLERHNLIVDMSLPGSYLREARRRLGDAAAFVLLRVTEAERQRRQEARTDRSPLAGWTPEMTALAGPPSLYDMVLDVGDLTVEFLSDEVLDVVRARWPSLTL